MGRRCRRPSPRGGARHHGLTHARLTQVMNLLLVAPDIQAEVLALRFRPGRAPVTERHLRQVLHSPVWTEQRTEWRWLRPAPAAAQ
jgi:hypothetical protein